MQPKLCLWLCLLVLVGALCAGNPFLAVRERGAAPLATDATAAPRARSVPASRRVLDGAARKALRTSSPGRALPIDAVVPAALAATLPAVIRPCPEPTLAPLVERVELDERGTPVVWVLRDGRRFVRNPRAGAGQPVLVSQ